MPEFEKEEFKFPDEVENKAEVAVEAEGDEIQIEIEDDTPVADRGREPLPEDLVDELEKDPLDDYSEKVKTRLKQMKRVWHDERRAKEAASREKEEAMLVAQKLLEENKRLKSQTYERELVEARQQYKEAYESGDSERLIEAQEKLTDAKFVLKSEEKALQAVESDVQTQSQVQQAQDPKALIWQQNNPWFGQDEEMTSLALGLHEKLKRSGVRVGSDDYYKRIDETILKRFPEMFEDEQEVKNEEEKPQRTKASTVVAPATRSTASKKVRLTQSQVAIAKKLGITPEQYVREVLKMEAR
jgi:hypothetical protein